MFNGKNKALTFSYDDGVTQDIRLIEIFNKYNLKCTFNLNSGTLGKDGHLIRDGVGVDHIKVKPEDVKRIYQGHEIAVHTVSHPDLTKLSEEEIVREVEEDRKVLSELAGYEVRGMAYPGGRVDDRVVEILKNRTGIVYSRAVPSTGSFEPFTDLLRYQGTLYHHLEWDKLFDMGKKFLELEAETPQVFYIWGHAYEFDIYPERWVQFEEFCKMMSNREDIFYGTNIEILEKTV